MKKYIKRYLFGILATTKLQPLFRGLCRLSLWGMNVGLGGGVEESGEKYALTKFAKTIPKNINPIIFDVGANHGQFALAGYKIIGEKAKIYSFEPSKVTFNALKQNLHEEHINIEVHNFGLGESDAELTLYADSEGSGEASLYKREITGKKITVTENVKIRDLDTFCLEQNIDHIHYLKLDVEGHELSVFKGAKQMLARGTIDWIQFEFGGCNIDSRTYFRDFFNLLSPQYHLYRLVRNGLIPINRYHETLEIFTTTNFIAISKVYANTYKSAFV